MGQGKDLLLVLRHSVACLMFVVIWHFCRRKPLPEPSNPLHLRSMPAAMPQASQSQNHATGCSQQNHTICKIFLRRKQSVQWMEKQAPTGTPSMWVRVASRTLVCYGYIGHVNGSSRPPLCPCPGDNTTACNSAITTALRHRVRSYHIRFRTKNPFICSTCCDPTHGAAGQTGHVRELAHACHVPGPRRTCAFCRAKCSSTAWPPPL